MLSTVKYITSNINNQDWILGNDIGAGFEDYIYKVIVKVLNATFDPEVKIYQTPSTRDDGKDIIITSSKDINLFGVKIFLKEKKEIKIYIECKSSTYDIVQYDRFAKNAIIAGQDKVDYFLLVTNQTITPYTYYSICENADLTKYEFILVDQYLLHTFLSKNKINKWEYTNNEILLEPLKLSYQICKSNYQRKPCFDLFLLCRNYAKDISECEISLMTDRNWRISTDKVSFIIAPNKGKCIKIKILKEYADGLDDILIHLLFDNHLNEIQIDGTSLSYNFELPLFGSEHKNIISKIPEKLSQHTDFWFNLYGEAGVGKTRIIDEVIRIFIDRSIRIISCICEKNSRRSTINQIKINASKVLKQELKATNLPGLLSEISNEFLWTIIVIEDIHNSDDEFIKMLDELISCNSNYNQVMLITSGRDDYTVYNEKYFSLLEKLNNISGRNVCSQKVKPLKDKECINLIKSTILDIPREALTKLHFMSKNNPFYLIQFIGYLLEVKLVRLLNRNTVGIPNILTFSQNIYIPEEIESLLKQRYLMLTNFPIGHKCQCFLKAAAIYGFQFPKKLLMNYFNESEYGDIELLFKTHFIISVDYETFSFDHETIYLFFKELNINKTLMKSICENIYEKPELFDLYYKLKQGIILYYLKKYNLAKTKFSEPFSEIENMENVSSENISPMYYEYFDFIYELAKQEKNTAIMEKTILVTIYVAIHNLPLGQTKRAFENAFYKIKMDFNNDEKFYLEVKQLESSFFLNVGMVSKARGIINDLLATERRVSTTFKNEIRFNLFERASSLYIHSNHIKPALEYNKMAFDLAIEMNSSKLKALAKINEAKIHFFSDTLKSYHIMKEAKDYLNKTMVPRLNCHNELGILTADMLLVGIAPEALKLYIERAKNLLANSIDLNYPLDIIRSHFTLAILHYLNSDTDFGLCNKYLNYGIDASVRYGILKLMGNLYNLKGLIAIRQKQDIELITKIFDTMLTYLQQEDLLFLGNLDFTYSNIILITNYLIFLNNYKLESKKYQFLSHITYYGNNSSCDFQCDRHTNCHYTCYKNLEVFKKNLEQIKNGSLLFVNPCHKFPLKSDIYYIPIYL